MIYRDHAFSFHNAEMINDLLESMMTHQIFEIKYLTLLLKVPHLKRSKQR